MHWLILFVSLLLPFSVEAATKEVIQGGGGDYTTIQACLNAMAAGDICNVHAATYTEQLTVKSGTAGNLKTVQRNGSDTVIVTSASTPVVSSANNDYWKFDGITFRYTGTAVKPSIFLDTYDGSRGAVNGWTITNCTFEYNGTQTGAITNEGFLIYIADASNATFTNNILDARLAGGHVDGMQFLNAQTILIQNNVLMGESATTGGLQDGLVIDGTDLTILDNTLQDGWDFDGHPDGIVIQGPNCCGITDRVLIKGNTLYNWSQGIYIDCFSGDCQNIDIFNNVLQEQASFSYGGNSTAMNCLVMDSENVGVMTVRIYNNTFDCQQLPVYYLRAVPGNTATFKNNLFFNYSGNHVILASTIGVSMDYNYYAGAACGGLLITYGATTYSFTGFVAATVHEDHGLCTTSTVLSLPANYQPDADANVIGRGVDLSAVFTTDLAGDTRTAPWTIGAYQYASGAIPPSPKFFHRRMPQ